MRNEKSYKIYVEKFGKSGIMSYLCCGKGMQVISVNKKRTIVFDSPFLLYLEFYPFICIG